MAVEIHQENDDVLKTDVDEVRGEDLVQMEEQFTKMSNKLMDIMSNSLNDQEDEFIGSLKSSASNK